MRTRTSPRNQDILWRALGNVARKPRAVLHYVVRTADGEQLLTCGHTVLLPLWSGRLPRERRCFQCEEVSNGA